MGMSSADSAKTQVEALRKKLLDLSLRNRMLNYKPSKRLGITISGEDSFQLHLILVEQGKKMSFVGQPDPPKAAAKVDDLFGREDDVAMAKHREAAEDELNAFLENAAVPVDQLDTKLNCEERESILQAKLRAIAREANLANEELGINTLFLTLGTLEWKEADGKVYQAPLLFVPVKLERQTNGSMRLLYDGSDVGSNLPLRAKLAEQNLKLPERDEDKSILDYFSQVESTIERRTDWHVERNAVCLGFFNYEKYAMYVDLGGENWPTTRKPWQHPDLIAMLGGGYVTPDSPIGDDTHLDAVRPVKVSREVFDADSSQTLAMIRASEGLSIVVEGPPGTGKSQTITNIIAESVAAGKTVLFVSAKRAALEVVKRNLERADLGPMCLDMHDKMTNRREFYSELKSTVSKGIQVKSEEDRVARLTELRDKLNTHSAAINEPLTEFETTPFAAMAALARLPKEQPEDRDGRIDFAKIRHFRAAEIDALVSIVGALQERLTSVGVPVENAFWGAQIDYLDPAARLDLEQDLAVANQTAIEAMRAFNEAAKALHIDVPQTAQNVHVLRVCAERARVAPPHDGVASLTTSWKQEEASIREVIAALVERRTLRTKIGSQVRAEAWTADLSEVHLAYQTHADKWFKFAIGAYRQATTTLNSYLVSTALDPQSRRELVAGIVKCQADEATVTSKEDAMRRLFGAQWQGLESDPDVLAQLLSWVLDLQAEVEGGHLPAGLLEFFSAQGNSEDLTLLANQAEQASNPWIEAYRQVANELKIAANPETDLWPEMLSRVHGWQQNIGRLAEYIAFSDARRTAIDGGLGPVVEIADTWPLASERLVDSLIRSYYTGVVREAMQGRPELRAFERAGHEASIAEFQSLDDFKLKYNRAQVRLAHQKRLPSFNGAIGNLALLSVQCNLQRSHRPIRWIMARAGEAIQRIKPVFMMSPLSVAIHLPPELPPFDMVIFDEASQIKPEDALSAIIRAKQAIVVGDTRQMPPTSFFDRLATEDDDIDEPEGADAEFATEAGKLESVLSLMSAVTMGRTRKPDLRWHYRSLHPSLIQPSNTMFYDDRLVVFPSPDASVGTKQLGIVFHHHPETIYEAGTRNRVNRKEAEIVADHVLAHVRNCPKESLLVAAMNKPQADLIYDEVQKRERLEPGLFAAFRSNHPHEPIDVKNLENVQGDERDVIFISVTYGRDQAGILRHQFGPLLQEGGERRLNVLITRARKRCEIFTNITADDIRLDTPRRGVESLKRYLRYAQSGAMDIATPTGEEEESPFEVEVTAALRDHGYQYHSQVGSVGYRIDIGVLDPNHPGRYLLGIECDGATYHSARSARDRDKLRQRVLESRGWTLHRIWSHDWWQDRDHEIRRLIAAIEGTAKPTQPQEPDEEPEVVVQEAEIKVPPIAKRPYIEAPTVEGFESLGQLKAYALQVVETEGPITEALLAIRIRNAAGYQRSGNQVRALIDQVILDTKQRVQVIEDALYWKSDQLVSPRDWSSRPTSERKADLVPEVELATALRSVVASAFGITPPEAVKAAYNLLGFKRVTETAQLRGDQVLSKMIAAGGVKVKDGLLSRA